MMVNHLWLIVVHDSKSWIRMVLEVSLGGELPTNRRLVQFALVIALDQPYPTNKTRDITYLLSTKYMYIYIAVL